MLREIAAATTPLAIQWAAALDGLDVRHHDPLVEVALQLSNEVTPSLAIWVMNPIDTAKSTVERMKMLAISTTRLTFFPGAWLARIWIAVGWAGYVQHEALELVTVHGVRPCDPHAPAATVPHRLSPFARDRGLRDGLPPELTPLTLQRALETAMDAEIAEALLRDLAGVD